MADEPVPTPQPTDALADQLRGIVRDELQQGQRAAMQRVQQEAQRQRQQVAQQQTAQQEEARWSDPVGQAVAPYVLPQLAQARFEARNAGDRADFYMTFDDAKPYRDEVEALFQQSLAARNPQTREALWYYWKGRNAERYGKDQAERHEQLTRTTNQTGAVMGPALHLDQRPLSLDDFRRLPVDQMEKVLEGHTF